MDITQIWVSQRNLRRADQIQAMIKTLANENLPRITLIRCEDGEIQVQDGHHRLVAIWLSGRNYLERHEYILLEQDQFRVRCGKLQDLLERLGIGKPTRLEAEPTSKGVVRVRLPPFPLAGSERRTTI